MYIILSGLNFLKDYTIPKSSDTQGKVVNFDQICTSHNHLIMRFISVGKLKTTHFHIS